jgi:AcrR family transcriptional regulator
MDEIAAAAGVAVGTLYRHFPTKTDLVEAVIAEFVEQVADAADEALKQATSGARAFDQLSALLTEVVEASASDHAVKAAARALGATPGHPDAENRAGSALADLIRIAQADGDVHPDVTVADLYLLFTTAPTDRPAEDRARWLELALRAIAIRTP